MPRPLTPPRATFLVRASAAAALGLAAAGASLPAAAQPRPDGTVAQEVILQSRPGVSIDGLAAAYGLTLVDQFGSRPIWRARVADGGSVEAVVQALTADARVVYAEPHVEHQAPESRHNVVWAIGGSQAEWAAQWAGPAMRLERAHRRATGAGVTVAFLDTGADLDHTALAGRWARRADGSLLGRDFVDDDADPREAGSRADPGYGHGTHVAGLIALAAPAARLMPVRVLEPSGQGNAWVLAEALLWAVDPDGDPRTADGAGVVNLSLGTTRPTRLLDQAVELATCSDDDDDEPDDGYDGPGFEADAQRCDAQGGAVVLASAGNDGATKPRVYPAAEAAEGKLAVAASTRKRRLASFSNRGAWVEVAAPGDRIMSTVPGDAWGVWSGTSMAAPLAAGVAALVRQTVPDWKAVDVTKRLIDRSAALCGTVALRQIDAAGAVWDEQPPPPVCR
ncbi:S8 family serine peptidase [Ideonella sp.]|uniref:S8 family serine peptidase n=1 Tax=Ideonella sp. TaxID=1929293 RepID=UPI0035B012D7